MANYLVTGAAGFIGARVTEMLLEDGHFVAGVDDLNDAYDVRLKHWRLKHLTNHPNFNFHHVDISDRNALECADLTHSGRGKSYDAIINLAARAGVRQALEDPWLYINTNVTGTLNLLELSRLYEIPKFIMASTSSVYGSNAPLPTPEEADSSKPLQPYAASKISAEALTFTYHYLYGIDVTVVRYFTVYGPASRPDMSMFRFTQWISEGRKVKLFGDGEQSRGFTYIDDIARGTILGLKPLGHEIINLGGHEILKINELIHILEELIGQTAFVEQLPAHPADMRANWANIEKAKKLLDWEPRVELLEGIANLVDWYRSEHSWTRLVDTE